MGVDNENRWVFADAWILTSIGICRQPCSPTEMAAAAEGINHAMPLASEVESAVGKLVGAGLVKVDAAEQLALTEAGRGLFARRRGSLCVQIDSVEKLLARIRPGYHESRSRSDLDG